MFSLMIFTALFWPAAGGLSLGRRQPRRAMVRIGISGSPGKKPGTVVQLQLK
jgi:hypothetical protein